MMKRILAACAVLAVSGIGSGVFAAEEASVVKGNIEIYGKAKVSVDMIDTGTKAAGADKSLTRVSSNSSRLGFKGKEDLGGDLSAVVQVELGINLDGGQSSVVSSVTPSPVTSKSTNIDKITYRNSYAGLSHSALGTLLAGIHDTPYKLSTGSLDPFGDTMGDYRALIGNVNGTLDFAVRAKDTLMYMSPRWGGVQVMAQTSTSGQESATSGSTLAKREYSASASYTGGPLYAALAYEAHKNGFGSFDAAGNREVEGVKAGAGFTFGNTKLGLVYEDLKDDTSSSAFSRSAYYVSLSQKFGSETLKLAYGSADDGESAATTGATLMVGGIEHSFSKRTSVYALYARMDNDSGASYGLGQGGAGGAYVPAAGQTPSVVSIGLNHNF